MDGGRADGGPAWHPARQSGEDGTGEAAGMNVFIASTVCSGGCRPQYDGAFGDVHARACLRTEAQLNTKCVMANGAGVHSATFEVGQWRYHRRLDTETNQLGDSLPDAAGAIYGRQTAAWLWIYREQCIISKVHFFLLLYDHVRMMIFICRECRQNALIAIARSSSVQ